MWIVRFALTTIMLGVLMPACSGRVTRITHQPPENQAQNGTPATAPPPPAPPPPPPAALDDDPPPPPPDSPPPLVSEDPIPDPIPDPVSAGPTAAETRAAHCKPAESAHPLPLVRPKTVQQTVVSPDYQRIRAIVGAACKSCHLAPGAASGGFSYLDQYVGQSLDANGTTLFVAGFKEAAAQMRDSVASGRMPPAFIRDKKPELYDELGDRLAAWVAVGVPETILTDVPRDATADPVRGLMSPDGFTDLGDCIPDVESIGQDIDRDYFFAFTDALPDALAETDLPTFDSYALAQRGTVSYNVEYPLWSDNAGKARHVHFPMTPDGDAFKRRSALYDENTHAFGALPDNTRLYKTFLRAVKQEDDSVVYRPVETRLIVVRNAPRTPLYGTYVWDETATHASLLADPRRDGSPWKDRVAEIRVDTKSKLDRTYVIPGKHRCEACHQGAANGDFVLGFTALQLNRRDIGDAGRDQPVGSSELVQAARLMSYGLLANVRTPAALPALEHFPSSAYVNEHVIRAQGYAIGNCAHCHNPKGLAIQRKAALRLDDGALFQFTPADRNLNQSRFFSNKFLVNLSGALDTSHLFERFAGSRAQLGFASSMPMHSAGGPDCRGATLLARWIKTYDLTMTPAEVAVFDPKVPCTADDAVAGGSYPWVIDDPTIADPGSYRPRRNDWPSLETGMPERYRALTEDPGLKAIVERKIPVDWWRDDPAAPLCSFPVVDLPADQRRPWMIDPTTHEPKQPLGEVFAATPGAWFFLNTCSKCHGDSGDGKGDIADRLRAASGGEVDVASFKDGMFGDTGRNLSRFLLDPGDGGGARSYAPNYMIWMAMEGTNINVPPDAAPYLGTHRAKMLMQIRDRCSYLIPTSQRAMTPNHGQYEIFRDVCLYQNLPVDTPEIQYDPDDGLPVNQEALDRWLDRGAFNAGFAIFSYLRDAYANGSWQVRQGECSKVYPRTVP